MPPRHHEREPEEAEDRARRPGRRLVGRGDERQDAAPGGAEEVDDEVLDVAVHLLDQRPEQVERDHVEGDVRDAEVDERAGEDAPPLPGHHVRAIDEELLDQRTAVAEDAHLPAAGEDPVGDEDRNAGGDERPGHDRGVGAVAAPGAVELAARGEVVAGLLEKPGDAVRDGPTLPAGARRSASR